jgi:hypothetical protein
MVAVVRTKLYGIPELTKALGRLTDEKFRRQVMNAAGRQTMQPFLSKVISAAPVLSGDNVAKNTNREDGHKAGDLKSDIKYKGKYNKQPVYKSKGRGNNKKLVLKPLSQYEWVGQITTGKKSEGYVLNLEYGRTEYTVVRIYVFKRLVDPFTATMVAKAANPWMRTVLDQNQVSLVGVYLHTLSRLVNKKIKTEANKTRLAANRAAKARKLAAMKK